MYYCSSKLLNDEAGKGEKRMGVAIVYFPTTIIIIVSGFEYFLFLINHQNKEKSKLELKNFAKGLRAIWHNKKALPLG